MRMMFPIGAVIWDSTACDIKHGLMAILPPQKISRWKILAGHFCQKKADRDNCFVSRKVSTYVEINPGVAGLDSRFWFGFIFILFGLKCTIIYVVGYTYQPKTWSLCLFFWRLLLKPSSPYSFGGYS